MPGIPEGECGRMGDIDVNKYSGRLIYDKKLTANEHIAVILAYLSNRF